MGPCGKKCRMDELKAEKVPTSPMKSGSSRSPAKSVSGDESSDSDSDVEVDVKVQLKSLSSKFDLLTLTVQKLV